MGEGTTRVNVDVAAVPHQPDQLERKVEFIRGSLTGIVNELDRRRHELLDWRFQLRKHRVALISAAAGVVLLTGGLVIVVVARERRRQRTAAVIQRLSKALRRIIDEPGNVARTDRGIGTKALASALSGAAGILAKSLTQRLLRPIRRG